MLLVYGGVGNGKTYLLEALSIELHNIGIYAPVIIWSELMRTFKKGMNRRPEPYAKTYDELFEIYLKMKYLILDDVGMGSSGSDWEWGQLEEIVNYRYRERLPTIIATNKDLLELPERIVSRFGDPEAGVIVLNEGRDYRRR